MRALHTTIRPTRWMLHGLLLVWAAGLATGEPVFEGPTAAEGYAGKPLDLRYTLRWEGAPEDVVVFPVTVEPIEGAKAMVLASEARAADGAVEVVQTIRVEFAAPVWGEWPPVTVAWAPAAAVQADAAPLRYMLEAPAIPLRIRDYDLVRRQYLGGGVVAVLVLGAAGFVLLWRRKRRPSMARAGLPPGERLRLALHEARQHRLDGDFYGYYRALSGAARLTEDAALIERIAQRTRAVGYQGVKPVDDDLDGDFKDVERAFACSREAANP